jgi:uncharacterized protein involved in outer membrane biogenesis
MARKYKILSGIGIGVILVLTVAVVLLATLDWNRFKPFIGSKASDALGRPFAINGDLQVEWRRPEGEQGWRAWIPWAQVTAHDISIGNTDWGRAPNFATLKQVQFRIALLPLLSHRVVLRQIQLGEPSVDLERRADGKANWEFTREDTGEPSAWVLDVNEIGFDKGRVGYLDETRQADVQVVIDPLGKPISIANLAGAALAPKQDGEGGQGQGASQGGQGSQAGQAGQSGRADQASQGSGAPANGTPAYVFGWRAEGKYKGLKVAGEGKVGGMLALQDANNPFPLEVKLAVGQTKASVAGTLTNPMNLGALDLRLTLAGASMADLYPLIGVALPDTPPYSTDGRLVARLQAPEGAVYEYRGFNGKVGESDIHGSLTYTASKPRPKLQGNFTSNLLRFADLGPLVGADTGESDGKKRPSDSAKVAQVERAAGKPTTGSTRTPADQPPDKALPVQEFRTERWKDMDADVTLKAKRIVQTAELPLTDLQTHVVLQAGVLSLTPLRFGMAGGRLDADIRLDGARTPMQGRAKISARGLKLQQLFPKLEGMKRSLGELNGDAALSGTGNSVAALLGTATGETKLLINNGVISSSLMELAGLNVGNYVVAKLFGDEEVPINCAAADVNLKDGLATPGLFVFDTENALVNISGSVDFKSEKMDLDITPHSKGLRIISLRSPLYVAGTLKDPKAGVKMGQLAARGAGMVVLGAVLTPAAGLLALIVPSNNSTANQCATMLREIQKAPKAPANPKAAPAKPASPRSQR